MSAFLFRKKEKPEPFDEELFKKVQRILSKQLNTDGEKITPDSRIMDELGADSLDIVELVMELEEAFTIVIPDEDVEKINTVKELVEYIDTVLKNKSA